MINVYESVAGNKRKSTIIMVTFSVFVVASVVLISKGLEYYYGYGQSNGLLVGMALIFSGISSFVSYYFSDRIILTMSGARPADKKTDYKFFTVAENLSIASSLPIPRLYVIDDSAMNAFATGRDPRHAVVCVTSGLLEKLSRTELEGVIGHELSHIANYDTRLMSVVTVLVGMITLLGDWLVRANWYGRGRDRSEKGNGSMFMVAGLILAFISPFVAQVIQLAISRRREFLADASSVKLTRQPSGLISALKKLASDREPLEAANKATAHLYITNPLKNRHDTIGWFANLFNTHPPIEERVRVLETMA